MLLRYPHWAPKRPSRGVTSCDIQSVIKQNNMSGLRLTNRNVQPRIAPPIFRIHQSRPAPTAPGRHMALSLFRPGAIASTELMNSSKPTAALASNVALKSFLGDQRGPVRNRPRRRLETADWRQPDAGKKDQFGPNVVCFSVNWESDIWENRSPILSNM